MLMKLLVIRIVPNNFLGSSNSFTTVFSSFEFDDNSSNSVCEIEKNATSVPETSAEQINKSSKSKRLTVVNQSKLDNNKNKGSGSGSNF